MKKKQNQFESNEKNTVPFNGVLLFSCLDFCTESRFFLIPSSVFGMLIYISMLMF